MRPREPRALPAAHRLPAALLGVSFLALTAWSWRRWPDLLVDFGQQLYIPWRLASGDRLYTDIAFLHGPLSQHVNALAFRLFGASLTTLMVLNLLILAALAAAVYRSFTVFSDRLTAAAAGLVLLTLFGFAHLARVGNYNFICPYTHEATHGLALTVAMIIFLSRYLERGGLAAAALSGVCLGLALLTKAEVALAAIATALLAGALLPLTGRGTARRPPAGALLFVLAALTPPLAFFLFFLSYMPAARAARAVAGGWVVLGGEVARNRFYLRVLGLDDPWGNLGRMLGMAALAAVLVLLAAGLDIVLTRRKRLGPAPGALAGAGLLLILLFFPDLLPWRELPRALPVAGLLALVAFVLLLAKRRGNPEAPPGAVPMVLWSGLAVALLGKVTLNVHLYHYGFYLALPATLVLVLLLTWWIPAALRTGAGDGRVFRGLAVAALAAGIVYHLRWSQEFYRLKDFAVGNGGDTILTYGAAVEPAGPAAALALRWIASEMPPDATFVAFPEGIMLNYLSRRPTTSRCMNFMMTEMIVFGEAPLLDGLKAKPPDYVLLVHKDTSEFGSRFFGADESYGRGILDWVRSNYGSAALVGHEPLRDEQFGIKILARTRGPAAGASR